LPVHHIVRLHRSISFNTVSPGLGDDHTAAFLHYAIVYARYYSFLPFKNKVILVDLCLKPGDGVVDRWIYVPLVAESDENLKPLVGLCDMKSC
jgi:hypothetical protein